MTEDGTQNTNPNATGNGGNGGGGNAGDGRDKWTREDWERFVQREADRRVTDALKKKEDEYKAVLNDTKTTADEKLKEYEARLTQERTRAEFMAEATGHGIADPKAAFAVMKEYGLTDKHGAPDFDALKKAHPALFGSTAATSAAGARPDTGGGGKTNMTALLRGAARG